MTNQLKVTVWRDYGDGYPDQTILHGIYGNVTLEDVQDIQDMFNEPELFIMPADQPNKRIGVTCSVFWGSPDDDCDGHWYFNIDEYVIVDDDDNVTHQKTSMR